MDPNETLRVLRTFYKREIWDFDYEEVCEILEHIWALDNWIKNGGFLPDDWQTSGLKERVQYLEKMIESFKTEATALQEEVDGYSEFAWRYT